MMRFLMFLKRFLCLLVSPLGSSCVNDGPHHHVVSMLGKLVADELRLSFELCATEATLEALPDAADLLGWRQHTAEGDPQPVEGSDQCGRVTSTSS